MNNGIVERASKRLGDLLTQDFHVVTGVRTDDLGGDHRDGGNLLRGHGLQAQPRLGGGLLVAFCHPGGGGLRSWYGDSLTRDRERHLTCQRLHHRGLLNLCEVCLRNLGADKPGEVAGLSCGGNSHNGFSFPRGGLARCRGRP